MGVVRMRSIGLELELEVCVAALHSYCGDVMPVPFFVMCCIQTSYITADVA